MFDMYYVAIHPLRKPIVLSHGEEGHGHLSKYTITLLDHLLCYATDVLTTLIATLTWLQPVPEPSLPVKSSITILSSTTFLRTKLNCGRALQARSCLCCRWQMIRLSPTTSLSRT